jgi:thiol-disulfide isomerase/thioredoxin
MVNIEEAPWCSPCQEAHREDECPRHDEDSYDSMNFMDMIYKFQEEYITQEQIDEVRKRGAREG